MGQSPVSKDKGNVSDHEDEISEQLQILLDNAPESFEMPVCEESSFGGLLTSRNRNGDAVKGLDPHAFSQVWNTIYEYSEIQTAMLQAKQKSIFHSMKESVRTAQAVESQLHARTTRLKTDYKHVKDIANLIGEVQSISDLMNECENLCQKIERVLPKNGQ